MSTTEKIPEKSFEKISEEANEMLLVADKPRVSAFKRVLAGFGFRVKTPSSTLAWIRYHRGQQTLDVAFNNGTVYRYFEVKAETVRDLLQAPSIGRQFNKHLRNEFRYQLLRGRVKPPVAVQAKASLVKQAAKSSKKTAVAA